MSQEVKPVICETCEKEKVKSKPDENAPEHTSKEIRCDCTHERVFVKK